MITLGFIISVVGAIFGFRWFAEHKFEYLEGVKPSEQMDLNFWLSIGFEVVGLIVIFAGITADLV